MHDASKKYSNQRVSCFLLVAIFVGTGCGGASQSRRRSAIATLMTPGTFEQWVLDGDPDEGFLSVEGTASDATAVIHSVKAGAETRLTRVVDASRLRGMRVLVAVSAKGADADSLVLRLSIERSGSDRTPWDMAAAIAPASSEWATTATAIDVPDDAVTVKVSLVTKSTRPVSLKPPTISIHAAPPYIAKGLSPLESTRLMTLARVVGYLRYFHPSDQVAAADWLSLEVEATDRLLKAKTDVEATEVFRWLAGAVAPTARIIDRDQGTQVAVASTPKSGLMLTRWVHIGFGNGAVYRTFREGINEPTDATVVAYRTTTDPSVARCAHVSVRSDYDAPSSMKSEPFLVQFRGADSSLVSLKKTADGQFEGDIQPGTGALRVGIQIAGFGVVQLRSLYLKCGTDTVAAIDDAHEPDIGGLARHLYDLDTTTRCDAHWCLRISRERRVDLDEHRDVVTIPLGDGAELLMPLAVWTDGARTVPDDKPAVPSLDWTPRDFSARLAAVVDVWSTLYWFYPYFEDLKIDWEKQLAPALDRAARARNGEDQFVALASLVSMLRDDHGRVGRREYADGVLPFFIRQIGSSLYVVSGVGPYESMFARGARVVAIDGERDTDIIERMGHIVSAATVGWREHLVPLAMSYGPRGLPVALDVVNPDGQARHVIVPRTDLDLTLDLLHEPRPESGTEVAPEVIYVDLVTLTPDKLTKLLPVIEGAAAVVYDARGYVGDAAFDLLTHLTDHEIQSPFWDTPIAGADRKKTYIRDRESMFPQAPRFRSRAIFLVDARDASQPETLVQMVHDNRLGLIVGEQTGGTNGNVGNFTTIGGLRIRFTAMRVLNGDGSLLQGHGVSPDLAVHPTLEGISSGRDEILDAAVRAARAP